MKRFIVIVLLVAFAFWVYKVPLNGKLPKLNRIRSNIIMQVSSSAFTNGAFIPEIYSCQGQNIRPPIQFSGIPKDARTLALIMDDPDAPTGTFTHWVVFNIPPDTKEIPEGLGIVPGVQAKNSAGLKQYTGPCPPSGVHRYYFKLYAIDKILPADEITNKADLQRIMSGSIIEQSEFMGKFTKEKQ